MVASALLGARQPRLPVAALVNATSLFGVSPGATRTCLWRMVSNGELTTDNATYALAGRLLERRQRVEDAEHPSPASAAPWDGTWHVAVVARDRRPAGERADLRRAAAALLLAELREGVWVRPDNLDPDRQPASTTIVGAQCVQFRDAHADISPSAARALFALDTWAANARRLSAALDAERVEQADLTYQFMLSVAVVRHLQLDPFLPDELLPSDWPADSAARQLPRPQRVVPATARRGAAHRGELNVSRRRRS